MYAIQASYLGSSCDNAALYAVYAAQRGDCEEATCSENDSVEGESLTVQCSTDYLEAMRDAFGDLEYIIHEVFSDDTCNTFEYAIGFLVTDQCTGGYLTADYYFTSNLTDIGTASIQIYQNSDGSSSAEDSSCACGSVKVDAARDQLELHTCLAIDSDIKLYDVYRAEYFVGMKYKWYSSNDRDDEGGLSTGEVVGIVCGSVAAVIIGIGVWIFYRHRLEVNRGDKLAPAVSSGDAASLEAAVGGNTGLWNDDIIVAKRIPRDKVHVKSLISRGAYGEVYSGRFNRHPVAVKMLIPSTRCSLPHVSDFLAEAKMTASMDHPHIVKLIGVSWDSLSDLCVVLELLDGGDLRALLNKYEVSKHPVGFDRKKATIALQVCHALTYLHSLMPPVIHRDLKSRNILLNRAMEAKLTDFGVSRERLDQTMTAGVGTSLWMAPEVMLGERYDVKADVFSFGVVLSELDNHALPYTQARQRSQDNDGRPMTDASLLQKITAGVVRVEFSRSNPSSIVELGLACAAVNPNDRPAAAESLYPLHVILSQDL